jgi:hypothetical protein
MPAYDISALTSSLDGLAWHAALDCAQAVHWGMVLLDASGAGDVAVAFVTIVVGVRCGLLSWFDGG